MGNYLGKLLEQLRQLVVAMVGREEVGCASGSSGGTVDNKVGEDDERDARESSPHPGRRLRGGKVTGHRETGCQEKGRKETGRKEMGGKEMGVGEMGGKAKGMKVSGVKATGEQDSQEMGGKGDRLMGEREIDTSLPGDKAAGQNVMEGIQQKSYSEVVIEELRRWHGCLSETP